MRGSEETGRQKKEYKIQQMREKKSDDRNERREEKEASPSELQNAPKCVSGRTVRLSDRYVCDLVLRGLNYRR
jgi:hypothetical protein